MLNAAPTISSRLAARPLQFGMSAPLYQRLEGEIRSFGRIRKGGERDHAKELISPWADFDEIRGREISGSADGGA